MRETEIKKNLTLKEQKRNLAEAAADEVANKVL